MLIFIIYFFEVSNLGIDAGFDLEQITRMAAHGGGSKNIEAVIEFYQALLKAGFDLEQITSIAARDGGANNIEAVNKFHQALLKAGFDFKQITRMAARVGGSLNLKEITGNLNRFLTTSPEFKLETEQAQKIADQFIKDKSIENRAACINYLNQLYQATLDRAQTSNPLTAFPYTEGIELILPENLAYLFSISGGDDDSALQAPTPPAADFSVEQTLLEIIKSRKAMSKDEVTNARALLKELKYSPMQVKSLFKQKCYSQNVKAVILGTPHLRNHYSLEKIIRIAAHDGGRLNIVAAIKFTPILIRAGFSPNNIFIIVARQRGYKNIEEIVEKLNLIAETNPKFKLSAEQADVASNKCKSTHLEKGKELCLAYLDQLAQSSAVFIPKGPPQTALLFGANTPAISLNTVEVLCYN